MRRLVQIVRPTLAIVLLPQAAMSAVQPKDTHIEATIRASGFPCSEVTSFGETETTEYGPGTAVTCDERHRYVLVYRRDAPVLVVPER